MHGTVKRFVVECCVLDPDADVVAAELYRAFEHWAAATGKRLVMLAHNFEERLMAAGLKLHAGSTSRNARWTGIALKQAS
ncbi:MAG: hypothetical protein LC126_24265 [Bryobacterales bacterium]|nr:hypothetical protein [Bryobacterales bacterium]